MDRDERGRFSKGNKIGNRFVAGGAQTETARKGAIASNAEQKRRKTMAERLAILDERIERNSKGEEMCRADIEMLQLSNKAITGDLKALRLKAEIQGYLKNEQPPAYIPPLSIEVRTGSKE